MLNKLRSSRKHAPQNILRHKSPVQLVNPEEVAKTNEVIVTPSVVSRFFQYAVQYPHNEVGALLLGGIIGRFLIIEDMIPSQKIGTAVNIEFTAKDFENTNQARKEGQYVIGWAHSHPTYGAFLSPTDIRFQVQGQGLFRDYIAFVMDPFHERGVDYSFFRVHDDQVIQVPHNYIPEASDASRTPNFD